jgi:hypothetical protein
MEPVRRQFHESGMSERELDALVDAARARAGRHIEKKKK